MDLDALTGQGTYRDQPGGVAAQPSPFVEATIATTPVLVTDEVYVFLNVERARLAPDQAPQRVGPCRWEPRPVDGGLLFPKRDDRCLVVTSDTGHRHIVWWEPATAYVADPWHQVGAAGEPTFANSWANLGGAAETLAFRLLRPDLVAFRGTITGGTALFQSITTALPAAYRPAKDRRIGTTAGDNSGAIYPVLIVYLATGALQFYVLSGPTAPIDQVYMDFLIAL